MFRTPLVFAAIAAFLFPFFAGAADDPVLTVQISANRVTASGVTPRGDVVLFGRSAGWYSGMRHWQRFAVVLNDEDRDGVVTFTLDRNVPAWSVFVMVDFETGAHAIASPEGFTPRQIDLPALVWRGGVSHVDLHRERVDVLFVRPKVGIWSGEIAQGGSRDSDARNDANLRTGLASLQPLAGTRTPPPTATPRDVIAIIDPWDLDVFARRAE